MELPLGVLVNRKDLVGKLLEKDFFGRTSLKLKILVKEVAKYFELYEEERIKLVTKFGEEKDGQVTVEKDSPNWTPFVDEINKLSNQMVEVTFPALTEEELLSNEEVKLSPRDLLDMEVFYEPVKKEEEEKKE